MTEETPFWYFGTLDIDGAAFKHDAGLSGKKIAPHEPIKSSGIVFGINKRELEHNEEGFWATWTTKDRQETIRIKPA